jgi:photosystem I protein
MTAQANKAPATEKVGTEVAKSSGKPPYPFRTVVSLLLLAGNFLVAAIYFHVLNI